MHLPLQVSPIIFNFWFAVGIVISGLMPLVRYPLVSVGADLFSWACSILSICRLLTVQRPDYPMARHTLLQELTPWGVLSGALLMISTASTFIAIDRIGLSISTGLLSGTSVIVSFSFGALAQGETFSRTWLALFAILILVAAIIAYAAAGQLASTADQQSEEGTFCHFQLVSNSVQLHNARHPYHHRLASGEGHGWQV